MGTIIPFVPLAKAFTKYLPKIADRPYSKVEAAFCLMVDYDDQNEVTVSGYAKLWQWNKKTVHKFIIDHGACIVYPKDTGNYKNQRGLISILKRDLKGANKGLITFIDNRDLTSNRDLKGANKGLKRDKSMVTTIEPKPKPDKKEYTEPFERWWKISPQRNGRRVGKSESFKAFKKIPETDWSALKTATDNYNKECGDYAKDPVRFLKDDFWKDYIAKTSTQSNGKTQAQKDYERTQEYINS